MTASPPAQGVDDADVRRFRSALRRMPKRQGHLELALRWLIRAGCRLVAWHVEIRLGELPAQAGRRGAGRRGAGCVVAVAPHRAWLEPFLLVAAWPPDAARLVWLADGHTVTRSWWRRQLLPRLGIIPITGCFGGPRAYAELAVVALAAGAALVVFPEVGAPSAPSQTRRISPGFAYLACAAGSPVIPVVTGGTHRILRGSSFSVDVLEAIEPTGAVSEVFSPPARKRAHELTTRYEAAVNQVLAARTVWADARRPERERWTWLATLFD
jgi:1-acyl-sn-glycerol-3-phosphate acyltransferase